MRSCVAEVQIRSVLQHAWAEIEHDLGYKAGSAIRRDAIRQFSRIAGLLEVADEGFVALRERLLDYEVEVSRKIGDKPNELLIDAVSFKALIDSDTTIQKTDELLRGKPPLLEPDVKHIAMQVVAASTIGFRTIGELNAGFQQDPQRTVRFAAAFKKAFGLEGAEYPGVSIAYFLALTAMEKGGVDLLKAAYPIIEKQSSISDRTLHSVQEAFDSLKDH